MIQDNFSLWGDLIFPMLALASVAIYVIILIFCWILLSLPAGRKIGRSISVKLVSRGWLLLLPSIFCLIKIWWLYPESMEPAVGAIYLTALVAAAWLTYYFVRSSHSSNES